MDDISKKREIIMQAYPSASWKEKVKKMSDNQVIAVWYRLKRSGRV